MDTSKAIATLVQPLIASNARRRWLALPALAMAFFIAILDEFIVNVAAPSIRRELPASVAEVQLVLAGYALAFGVTVLASGRLGDIYGRRRMFLVGLGSFTLASALCSLAPGPLALIAARVLQGLAAAIMTPQIFALVHVAFTPAERALVFGVLGAVAGLAAIGGQIVGGWLIAADAWGLGWRGVFLVNLPLGVLALLGACLFLDESRSRTATRLDVSGMLLASATLTLLIVPLMRASETGWDALTAAALLAATLLGWLFIRYERHRMQRIGSPLLDLALFRSGRFRRGIALQLIEAARAAAMFFVLTMHLQVGAGYTALQAGATFVPLAIAYAVGACIAARLAQAIGPRTHMLGALLAVPTTLWLGWVAVVRADATNVATLALPLVAFGLTNALINTPLANLILASAQSDDVGSAAGMIDTAKQIGTALGVALAGAIFFGLLGSPGAELPSARAGISSITPASARAFCAVMLCLSGTAAAQLGIAWGLPRAT